MLEKWWRQRSGAGSERWPATTEWHRGLKSPTTEKEPTQRIKLFPTEVFLLTFLSDFKLIIKAPSCHTQRPSPPSTHFQLFKSPRLLMPNLPPQMSIIENLALEYCQKSKSLAQNSRLNSCFLDQKNHRLIYPLLSLKRHQLPPGKQFFYRKIITSLSLSAPTHPLIIIIANNT